MQCYHCKTTALKPTQLEFGLPALRCPQCEGTYLDLLTYRAWQENFASQATSQADNPEDTPVISELSNTETALLCQRCHKFMLKYRINNQQDNTVNVCHTCDDVWLDRGEWALLKQLNIEDKLTEVMGEPWQHKLRQQSQQQAFRHHFQKQFSEDFGKIDDFAQWLQQQPNKAQILHYLAHSKD